MKKTLKTNTVTDEQGRVRFHGAFTGGFSAGYYNTVGSSEGFQPAQFVSSRSNRAAQPSGRSIADYMDEGDGLLGGKLSAHAGIDSFSAQITAGPQYQSAAKDGSVSGSLVNEQLISNISMLQKSSDTVGKRLLATMGWRVGQGIGPRVTKKRVNYFDSKVNVIEMHPGVDMSKLPKSSLLSKGAVTFAPDDEGQRIEYPPIKNDFYGVGFDVRNSGRLDIATHHGARTSDYIDGSDEDEASNVYRMDSVMKGKTAVKGGSKRPHGQQYGQPAQKAKRLKYTSGFAYNDEEDDVYSNDVPLQISNGTGSGAHVQDKVVPYKYSHEVQEVSLHGDSAGSEYLTQTLHKTAAFAEKSKETLQNIHSSVDNWLTGGAGASAEGEQDLTGPGALSAELASQRCPSDNRLPLPGFHVARTPRVVPPYYPPPQVPADFRAHHSFAAPSTTSAAGSSSNTLTPSGTGGSADSQGHNGTALISRRQAPLDAAKARSAAMSEEVVRSAQETGPAADAAKYSIFDLIKPEARAKLQSAIHAVNPQSSVQLNIPSVVKIQVPQPPPLPPLPPVPPPPVPPPPPLPAEGKDPVPARPMLTSSHLLNSTFAGLSQAFKNRFASASTTEGAGAKDSIVVEGMATATEYNKKLAERQEEAQRKEAAHAAEMAKKQPKVVPLKGSVRTVTPWAPSPLLCKRFNVKLPDISRPADLSGGPSNVPDSRNALNPLAQLMGGGADGNAPVAGFGKRGAGLDEIAAQLERERRELDAAAQDVYQAPTESKPALSVFKSIFEDSDEEDDEEEEGDGGESGEGVDQADSKSGKSKDERPLQESTPEGAKQAAGPVASTLTKVSTAAPTAVLAAESQSVPLDGPVQFVSSKHRTTLSHKAGSGTASSFGAAARRPAAQARRSFQHSDDEDEGEEMREEGPRTTTKAKATAAGMSTAMRSASGSNNLEDSDGEGGVGLSFKPATGRTAPQSIARVGGVSVGGAARKSRAPAEGSLRQRLIAQRLAEEEEVAEGTGPTEGTPADHSVPPPRATLSQAISKDTTSATTQDRGKQPATSTLEMAQSVKPAPQDYHRSSAPQRFANDAAVEDVLSFVDNILQPTPSASVPVPLPVAPSVPSAPHPPGVDTVQSAARVSRFGAAAPAASSSSAQHSDTSRNSSVAMAIPLPPSMKPPAPPPQPLPPPPGARDYYGPSAPAAVRTDDPAPSSAAFGRPADFKSTDIKSSIQKLQGFLAPPEPDVGAKKERNKEHKDKKSHKSHKSGKHKHKKDSKGKHKSHKSKKERERSRKESSSSESDGSSSSGSEN